MSPFFVLAAAVLLTLGTLSGLSLITWTGTFTGNKEVVLYSSNQSEIPIPYLQQEECGGLQRHSVYQVTYLSLSFYMKES